MMPPDSLKLRVLEAARHDPVPPRTDRRPATLALAVISVLGMAAMMEWGPLLFGDVGGTAHASGRPANAGAFILGGTLALALASTRLVLPRRGSMLAPPRAVLLGVAVGVPLLVGAWLMLWHAAYVDPFSRVGWRCFGLTTLTAPWPFVTLVFASRRTEPRHPALAGAALGAVAGAWAAVMVELWCPLAVHAHVVIGHVLPLFALTLAGAAFGARAFRIRRV